MMLLLSPFDMATRVDECAAAAAAAADCSSADGVESFRDRGKRSSSAFWFKLRSAIFDDGGTGRTGIGRIR